ncbi:MAG: type VI secretion system accessory protein TagJ [Candidatus Rokuibacteriota bacterium]
MGSEALFHEGRLDAAVEALGKELQRDPADLRRRTFLFELLCFSGKYDRAEKHLDVVSTASQDAAMGALLYRSALHAERIRQEMFRTGEYPRRGARAVSGTLNGRPFDSLADADPRIGARLEVFAAGEYLWLPLEHVASVRLAPPKRLRDLLWAPAVLRTGPGFKGVELGEVLLPVLAPRSWEHDYDAVRLGRVTAWSAIDDGHEAPVGQKLFLVDGEEFPILELRELEIAPGAATST